MPANVAMGWSVDQRAYGPTERAAGGDWKNMAITEPMVMLWCQGGVKCLWCNHNRM